MRLLIALTVLVLTPAAAYSQPRQVDSPWAGWWSRLVREGKPKIENAVRVSSAAIQQTQAWLATPMVRERLNLLSEFWFLRDTIDPWQLLNPATLEFLTGVPRGRVQEVESLFSIKF